MALIPFSGPLGKKRAAHLLRRACFGASIPEIDAFAIMTAQEAFDSLYQTDLPTPSPPIDPQTNMEWLSGTTDLNSEPFDLTRFLNAWMIGQSMAVGVPTAQRLSYTFRERIVFFIQTLLTTKQSIANSSIAIYYQQALFRIFAFDKADLTIPSTDPLIADTIVPINLRELTKKICVDNAMLRFLDGRLNVKGSPNENFARELLELFSIGKGLEGDTPKPEYDGDYFYFTEQDVRAAARVLSGFDTDTTFSNLDEETGIPKGVIKGTSIASQHDNDVKVFSERFGNASIIPDPTLLVSGQPTEASCLAEISDLIDLIYNQDQTGRYLVRKLYRFFVYHQVSPALEQSVLDDLYQIFIANDYKIIPVLEALFTSTHFFDGEAGFTDDAFGGLIKSPFDLIVGFYKNWAVSSPDYEALALFNNFHLIIRDEMSRQGMDFYEPDEVAGYGAYHQFPIYNRSWITTNYLTNRYSFISRQLSNGMNLEIGQVYILPYILDYVPAAIARQPKELITYLAGYFLPVAEGLSFDDPTNSELTSDRLNYFLQAFLYSPQIDMDPEASWTSRYDNRDDMETMANQVVSLMNAMLQSPEYQLM